MWESGLETAAEPAPTGAFGRLAARARDFFDRNRKPVGLAAVVATTATASATLTPWAAVPLALGAAYSAVSFGRGEKLGFSLKDGALAGATLMLFSMGGNVQFDPYYVPQGVQARLNDSCWMPGQQMTLPYSVTGKPYNALITSVTDSQTAQTDTTFGMDVSRSKVVEESRSHTASATVAFSYRSFWTGKEVPAEEKLLLKGRAGLWQGERDELAAGREGVRPRCVPVP